jgi:hypothetical protein
MPRLGFGKHRLDPDVALADRFLVRLGRVVATDLVEVVLVERALVGPTPAPNLCDAPQEGVDSDGDGMYDPDECNYFGTLPNDANTDNDGLEDDNAADPNAPNDF